MKCISAHCNTCRGDRNHDVLHSESTSWTDRHENVSGGDNYATLKCRGCENIKLRHASWFSERDESEVTYFPAAIHRYPPRWLNELTNDDQPDKNIFAQLLSEIYTALHNNLNSLAAMGIRALLEQIMIFKSGDLGTFGKNLNKFQELGHLSQKQRSQFEVILEAGHAAMHRFYAPKTNDLITLLDVTENIIESVFLHDKQTQELSSKIPKRLPK